MSVLTILEFPDERLRKKAAEVQVVDGKIKNLVDDMLETMYLAKGIGLAATQVNVHQRIVEAAHWPAVETQRACRDDEVGPLQRAAAVDGLERVDAHDGIDCPIDLARDQGHDTALRANVELGRLGTEDIARNTARIGNCHAERTGGTGSPYAPVLDAERAGAGSGRDLGWLGFPQQLERKISAVTASTDQQERLLSLCYDA